jgi:phosphoribosylformylglycinamidine synthase
LPIDRVGAAIEFVREAVRARRVTGAHDISDGGFACALAECAIAGGVGARVDLDPLVEARGCSGETALFGEGAGGFVVAAPREQLDALAAEASAAGVELTIVGEAHGDRLDLSAAEADVNLPLADAARAWRWLGEWFT